MSSINRAGSGANQIRLNQNQPRANRSLLGRLISRIRNHNQHPQTSTVTREQSQRPQAQDGGQLVALLQQQRSQSPVNQLIEAAVTAPTESAAKSYLARIDLSVLENKMNLTMQLDKQIDNLSKEAVGLRVRVNQFTNRRADPLVVKNLGDKAAQAEIKLAWLQDLKQQIEQG